MAVLAPLALAVGPTMASFAADAAFASALAGGVSFGTAASVASFASAVGSIAPVLSGVGTVMSAVGARNAGVAAQQESNFRAKQGEINAGQERASAQRQMIEDLRRTRIAQSRGQAVAAASGAGALDPSVMDIMGDLETEGRYRAATSGYEGEERARDLETGAVLARYEGKNAKKAGNIKAISTLMSGATDLYTKYDGGSYG